MCIESHPNSNETLFRECGVHSNYLNEIDEAYFFNYSLAARIRATKKDHRTSADEMGIVVDTFPDMTPSKSTGGQDYVSKPRLVILCFILKGEKGKGMYKARGGTQNG